MLGRLPRGICAELPVGRIYETRLSPDTCSPVLPGQFIKGLVSQVAHRNGNEV